MTTTTAVTTIVPASQTTAATIPASPFTPYRPTYNNLQTVSIPANEVDNGAKDAIQKMLEETFAVQTPANADAPDFWTWKTTRGTFVKRLAKWLRSQGHHPSNDFLGKVGDIAGSSVTQTQTFAYDFDRHLDWYAGDFGDGGSCFWGSNAAAREIFRDNGVFALRFFDEDGDGIARSWIAPLGDGLFVLFNGYNNDGGAYYSHHRRATDSLHTLAQARIFAHIIGGTYKKVDLYNNGDTCGTVYINSGRGYLVGPFGKVEPHDDCIDLELEDDCETCYQCGCRVDPEYSRSDDYHTYCEECYSQEYGYCHACEEDVRHDDLTEINGEYLCDDCRDRYFHECTCCEDYLRHDRPRWSHATLDTFFEVDGEYYCEDCFNDRFTPCEECGEPVRTNGDLITVRGEGYCEDCASRLFAECCECGCYTHHDDAHTQDGETYCEACFNRYFEECATCGDVRRWDDLTDHLCPACHEIAEDNRRQLDAGQTTFDFTTCGEPRETEDAFCTNCGEPLPDAYHVGEGGERYCSNACRALCYEGLPIRPNLPALPPALCACCGRELSDAVTECEDDKGNTFCTEACRSIHEYYPTTAHLQHRAALAARLPYAVAV